MNKRGFTLIEVMLTVVVLSLGTLLIQESYLRTAHLFGVYANTFRARAWVDEKMWELREASVFAEAPASGSGAGSFTVSGKVFRWQSEVTPLPGKDAFALKVNVDWNEGNRPTWLTQETYATKTEIPLALA